ncbi:probable 3',5'-cyclic phosphodiesterase pde-5 isoform X2 [Macrosteles quadrilineatus]|uniref:probable 3',5'-cyclic phosphodiesterase pde-5 isoform X2 n=1 Tax=Macrosteles quadrilineatus TaxID=74068 RepID=UPI0023E29716|nr:probable 3',5'-cyclic phosphodiesterase pde-5 isoform X2 [Macrosteles quadrilineatus]
MWTDRVAHRVSRWFNSDRRSHRSENSIRNSSAENGVSCTATNPEVTEERVAAFLRCHPEFLESWVMEEVQLEQLERWIIRRTQKEKKKTGSGAGRKTSLSRWKFCVHADKRQMLQEMTSSLQRRPSVGHVLWELCGCIASAVSADGHRLYLSDTGDSESLCLYLGNSDLESQTQALGKAGQAASLVARTKEPLRLSRGQPNFPNTGYPEVEHLLYEPVVQPDGELVAVLELWRRDSSPPFHEEDEEIASSYLVWGGIALHYARLYLSMSKQRKLSDFLLAVVKSIFQDMMSMDTLVTKIMNFAQRLVDADRASLFLLDSKNKELYARIFDVRGNESENDSDSGSRAHPDREIRFSVGKGIAGQVARTGEVLNIADAYSDPRFNSSVDHMTGYHTKTILCMPIFIRGVVIGVMQMVNKNAGFFNKEDEEAFETFAVYCGLALHHAKLYEKIRRSEQKYRVALEVLCYHNSCNDLEFAEMKQNDIPTCVPGIDEYYFNVYELDDNEKVRNSIYMFIDLFGLSRFDKDNLIKFTLTVKKNYRRVPYHNWSHGFSVANSMYAIIKHSPPGTFNFIESVSLYIAALCHDLDHRGKNNKFMSDTESPLAAVYSTSTMEHHHFNQTVTILQQPGHNIFSQLTSSEYKQVLGQIKHCILATDLARFFPYKTRLQHLVASQTFSPANPDHRLILQAIAMTASDLSASAKPWDIQFQTARVIFEEFYEQGDAERQAGITPVPMMDRNQPELQAVSQVGFLMSICIPCYVLLSQLIPETKPLLAQCQANLEQWKLLQTQQTNT